MVTIYLELSLHVSTELWSIMLTPKNVVALQETYLIPEPSLSMFWVFSNDDCVLKMKEAIGN